MDRSAGLELVVVKQGNVRRKYVLDVKSDTSLNRSLRKALIFSQGQLLQEIRENGYNVLLSERLVVSDVSYSLLYSLMLYGSWQVTLLRRATLYRIEVEYTGLRMCTTCLSPSGFLLIRLFSRSSNERRTKAPSALHGSS